MLDTRLLDNLQAVNANQPLGLYIHVPFCRSRCAYCSFVSCTDLSLEPSFLKRLVREIEAWGRFLGRPPLDTAYIGGGTPSMLSAVSLRTVSQAVCREFDTSGLQEATVEINPGSISPGWLEAAARCGWGRISIGVQALDDAILKNLGRAHNAAQGLEAIKMCKDAGFGRISADLLLGAPGQQLGRIFDDAACLAGAGAEHLSIYMLDLDKQCPMKAQLDDGFLTLPPDGLIAETYLELQARLPLIGMYPYEICNCSRPGCRSIHNTRYWQRRPYLGVGPGAASNIGNLRWKENENIVEWVNGAGKPEAQSLTPEESLAEIPLLALRMHDGADWQMLRRLAESQGLAWLVQKWENELAPFIDRGFVQWDGGSMRLTHEGMVVGNQIFQVFV
jgi:oxygen-independent coproporphyrinogen-3 oxidase